MDEIAIEQPYEEYAKFCFQVLRNRDGTAEASTHNHHNTYHVQNRMQHHKSVITTRQSEGGTQWVDWVSFQWVGEGRK
jgi:hypothetical protein